MKKLSTMALLVLLGAATPQIQAQTTESYTFSTNRVVPDGDLSGLSDERSVASAIGTITSVKVRLKVTGEFNGDLYGYLRHSGGFTVLINRPGRTASDAFGYGDSGLDVTFQTGASNGDLHAYRSASTPANGSPLTGIWQPDGRNVDPTTVTDASSRTTSLTNFNNLDAAGSWTLYLVDADSGATNMLTEWGLDISGAASPTLTWSNPANIVYGDALGGTQLNAVATYNATNVPGTFSYSPTTGTVLNAGAGQTLSVTFTPTDTNGFLPVTTTVAINVSPAPLTITAVDKSKIYGADLPALTASYSGFVNGDSSSSLSTAVSLATVATAASPVGTYTITASGAVGANYDITHVNGTLTVTPAALTITAVDKSKIYGASLPTLTASYSGFVNGDTASSLGTPVTLATIAIASSPIGTYAITASGAIGTNYSITHVDGTLTIAPAELTITAVDKTKVYGASLPTFTASYSGFVNGDTAANLSSPVALGTTATASSPIGTYTITATGAVDTNYSIILVNGILTVTPAALTITAVDKTKVYGADLPALTASYSGFVNGDTSSSLDTPVTLGTTAVASSPAGTYPITATGAADTNYSITLVDGSLTVTPAALTITAVDKTKVYGADLPTLTASYSGFVNGDTSSSLDTAVSLSTTATASSPSGAYGITASGAADANYSISYTDGTLTVTTANITITADDKSKVYGAALPVLSASYSGFVLSDGTNNLGTLATVATTATSTSDVGTYPITASGATSTNYTFNYVGGTLTITQSLSSGLIVSSANPAVPGTNVTFTATLNATAPGSGTPGGTVDFRIDGSIAGSGNLTGGVATFATSSLALGSHIVVAEYAGNLNFVGSTNALAQPQVINTPPIAGNDTIYRNPMLTVKVRLATLLANDSDADSDGLNISVSPSSINGATISVSGGFVFYTPATGFTNADSFTYTITDGRGGSAVATVTVALQVASDIAQNLVITALGENTFRIDGNGIPGRVYRLQRSVSSTPFNWQDLTEGSLTADNSGRFQYTDTSASTSGFYRSVSP